MPVIEAKRRGHCAACGDVIPKGELIAYEAAIGARHLACADRDPELRRNTYRLTCSECGASLKAGEGTLTLEEHQDGDRYVRTWRASCADVGACRERLGL